MQGISYARLLLSGLVAGLVILFGETLLNQIVLADDWAQSAIDQDVLAFGAWQSMAMAAVLILFGIVLMWIHAIGLPRFGSTISTAIAAGLTLWLVSWALLGVTMVLSGATTVRIAAISAVWGVIEVPAAALAGAWIYQDRNAD